MNNFVTYVYYDPSRDHEPFYVGKGRPNRPWVSKRYGMRPVAIRLREMSERGVEPAIGVYGGLTEGAASRLERELIAQYGRVCKGTGPLVNITVGGGRISAGHSNESRSKISAAFKVRWADPVVKANLPLAIRSALADPRVRERMSVGRRTNSCLAK